jgi:phospholipase/lecithinase/hemolysin
MLFAIILTSTQLRVCCETAAKSSHIDFFDLETLMKFQKHLTAVLATTALLVACGGGDDDKPKDPAKVISRVIVAGDSLADAGTFGVKATVQRAGDAAGYPVFTQIVSSRVSVPVNCNVFRATATSFTTGSTTTCTNFAISGGRVVVAQSSGGAANPQTIPTQLRAAATAYTTGTATYATTDLFVIDGGGNDAADLVGAYLGAGTAAGAQAFQTFLAQQLDGTTIGLLLAQSQGPERAAGAYMTKLADTYFDSVKSQVLDKGGKKVALLNMPDITITPRFQALLAGVRAQAGAASATALQGAIRQWIGAFNTQLRTRVGTTAEIALIDFYAEFTAQVTNPGQFGLTNVTQTVCPAVGTDSQGLPRYDFPTCTDGNLDLNRTTSQPVGWWRNHLFSDGFHPTPYGHELLANTIERSLRAKGWI